MALDEALTRTPDTPPTFRIYYWNSPSISIGYFQKAVEVLNTFSSTRGDVACELASHDVKMAYKNRGTQGRTLHTFNFAPGGINLVRRPTGGTAVFHDDQPSFTLVLKTPAKVSQIYKLLGKAVIEALKSLGMDAWMWEEKDRVSSHFCTSNVSPFDVILDYKRQASSFPSHDNLNHYKYTSQGQKVAGYSARRYQGVALFQGYFHLPVIIKESSLVEALIAGMEKVTKARLKEGSLSESEALLTQELRHKKYLQGDWNFKR
ncbi:MAG TPA: lipoate--protein ligase family protein [Candidatus Hypogeohydataceae bacterium YC41]